MIVWGSQQLGTVLANSLGVVVHRQSHSASLALEQVILRVVKALKVDGQKLKFRLDHLKFVPEGFGIGSIEVGQGAMIEGLQG